MFKPVSKDRLFFDQYRYSMCFRFPDSGRMRVLKHDAIQESISYAAMYRRYNATESLEQAERMFALCDTILAIDVPYKRMVYTDWQYFYTNDPGFFQILQRFPGVTHCSFQEAVVDRPRDTVILTESRYKWRSYFRDQYHKTSQLEVLRNFLAKRPEQFRVTDNWARRLQKDSFYITRSFFVDHHDEKDAVLLHMAMPGAVRKTMPIIERQ